jgi:hypothetical protein
MGRGDEIPRVDFGTINFPTDSITLGTIRRHEPDMFTMDGIGGATSNVQAIATLFHEEILAEKTFAVAIGRIDPHPDMPRPFLVRLLDGAYRAYGISSGPKQSVELVRGIERQASEQARAMKGGVGRG